MKTRATPTDDRTENSIETYARTGSDGTPELVVYTPGETHEWINAASASVVDLEDYR
ncbi:MULTISPECIES: hypothetical protein [Halorussus]|uniref:hypothetical protein n=1 Tax=Halorussus TaxID=1070314 RepID=UPI00209D9EF8|nr:hypothetical protein [Halorussus vallis]USZ74440.1 hypothetical protein NGM07_13410 [Halorussus vallis]